MAKDLGEALGSFMAQNSLTQQEVSERTGVAQPVIGRILKGAQPELRTMKKLANGLGIDMQIGANGEINIEPLDKPNNLEFQVSAVDTDPLEVHFTIFDRVASKQVVEVTLLYSPGEIEPHVINFKRKDWIPGYVSNEGLLRWAKAYGNKLMQSSSLWISTY